MWVIYQLIGAATNELYISQQFTCLVSSATLYIQGVQIKSGRLT